MFFLVFHFIAGKWYTELKCVVYWAKIDSAKKMMQIEHTFNRVSNRKIPSAKNIKINLVEPFSYHGIICNM